MRPISSELAAVQRVRSPRARVTVAVEGRGQSEVLPPVAWAEVVGNAGQSTFRVTAAVGLADGRMLKFVALPTGLTLAVIADPTLAAVWQGAAAVTLVAGGMLGVAALRAPSSSTVRAFYITTSNQVAYVQSGDNGSSWGGPVTVYAGGDAVGDLVVAHIANGVVSGGPWFVGFSTYDGGAGVYTPRFGDESSGWVMHAYESGWRAAGIDAYAPAAARHRVLVLRQRGLGSSRLRALDKTGSTFANAQDIDQTQAGRFGLELLTARLAQLPEVGATAGILGEGAYGAGSYQGVCSVFDHGDPLVDEPVILPTLAASAGYAHPTVAVAGGDLYVVGDTAVWRGARQAVPSALPEPVRYRYADGQMTLTFPAAPAPDAPLAVGQVLVVTRTLAWEGQAGSATLRLWAVRVEEASDAIRVLAVDAVGLLGLARCRRPAILQDGSVNNLARVMRRLGARVGLRVGVDAPALESAPVLPMTLQPAESLGGAAYRIAGQQPVAWVPANDGSFALTLITPPSSSSGHYADVPHRYGDAAHQQPLLEVASISDYRRLAFSYVLGSASTDPEDGAAVAMAAGPVIANTRPLSYSLTNQRYNTVARVSQAAATEAARQHTLPVTARLTTWANLALERYDVVEVTEPRLGWDAQRFRVRDIIEEWETGSLTQTLELGEA